MQTSDDVHLLHILSQGNGRVVAEQLPSAAFFPVISITTICVLVAVYLLWRRRWQAFIPLLVIALAWLFKSSGATYRVTLDQDGGQIAWQEFQGGTLRRSRAVAAKDLATANVAFGKAGGRLVLVHPDGNQEFPLGDVYVVNEPVQFILAQDLQQMISRAR